MFLQHFVLVPHVHVHALVQSEDSALHGHFLVEHVELQLHLTIPLSLWQSPLDHQQINRDPPFDKYILFGRLLNLNGNNYGSGY